MTPEELTNFHDYDNARLYSYLSNFKDVNYVVEDELPSALVVWMNDKSTEALELIKNKAVEFGYFTAWDFDHELEDNEEDNVLLISHIEL